MIVLQLILYCLFYMGLVAFFARKGPVNVLYFYPKPVQERAIALDLTDGETVARKRKRFLISFSVAILAALVVWLF